MGCTENIIRQKLQLLCYVTFFDILHHFGVIAASEICSVSVSRKYCAILRNRFFILQFQADTFHYPPLVVGHRFFFFFFLYFFIFF